ncbi:patatin-like phospholipase family protein [Methylobacterium nodulans]|uniref:Cyclic nucleotide-binding protein n=1 Tax=Methylobacterium nodulans (strain LMG 21967 / CNCM I-2342 / ORS 2060) TaxID=460265 RepID=B8IUG2_METNO|nr:patatin-like phospholipase family protein [Methylobacterium nodulans]ACL55207.1 cyclic nucleotide-binding protein [Methylobacterium nodulans ORS 2060]
MDIVDGATHPEIPFLAPLDLATAAAVRERLEPIAVAGGQILFEQDAPADALYALVSGAIGISARDPASGEMRPVARVRPPETVGEMALLSGEPRSATATVLRDSYLLRLSKSAFDDLVECHPATMLYFARLLAARLRSVSSQQPLATAPMTFAVIGVTEGVEAAGFASAFAAALPGRSTALATWPEEADETWFHALETAHDQVVYAAEAPGSGWANLCLRRADHVLLLAAPRHPPRGALAGRIVMPVPGWTRQDLVVLNAQGATRPGPLDPAVTALPVALRLQARAGNAQDLARIARLAGGRARGLVLGGGGARGFAHLGVMRALAEAGLAVDLVAGTSMGAVTGASLAMGWDLEEIVAHTVAAFVESSPLNDYTLPITALTRGAKVDRRLALHFGDARIEDLWLPFFCVSSNLTTGAAMVHREGPLVPALRASIAIPGLLPPVLDAEGVLVDGGVMNNLPADLMAALGRGTVLAVDVASDLALDTMPRRSLRSRVLRRALGVPFAMPSIAQILLRAATVSSDASAAMARDRATAVLRPPLAGIDLRAWRSYAAVAEIGYRDARARLAEGALDAWAAGMAAVR